MEFGAELLIDSIYEAAVVPERWPFVLESLARMVNAVGGVLFAVDASTRASWVASEQLVDIMRTAASTYSDTNIRPQRALAKRHAGFMADTDFLTEEDRANEAMYVNLLKPNGLLWACGTVVPIPSRDLLVVDFERTSDAGPFNAQSLILLDTYRPHLARAGVMASRLHLERARGATALLQDLGLPAAVLASGGRVVAMNALLEHLSSQVYTRGFDRLTISHAPSNHMLEIALAGIDSQQSSVSSIAIPAAGNQPGLVGHVVPIRRNAHDIFAGSVALFVATPLVGPPPPNAGLLSGLFDLTPAEDRVARMLAEGHSIQSCASALSVSVETVRTQLKSVMAKTGTSRQAELLRLLAGTTSLPLPKR